MKKLSETQYLLYSSDCFFIFAFILLFLQYTLEKKNNFLVLLSQEKKEAHVNKLLVYVCICLFSSSKTFEDGYPPTMFLICFDFPKWDKGYSSV